MLQSQPNIMLQAIADYLYPVGSYYITESSELNTVEKMNTHFGGEWIALDAGRFLEAGDTVEDKDAGLPNITGSVNNAFGLVERVSPSNSGATKWRYASNTLRYQGSYKSNANTGFTFDASKGEVHDGKYNNLIYGKSDTVQPKSRVVYIYRRTALSGGAV